ncbi:hypothetical protein OTUT144_0217 [Orientia tsutsugamushi str. UT144]|uniref:Uncharacterized protein n=1 Tax=Orientia tsutsugamushi str. UT144 TaxID=1441384 RepID=A0A0F3RRI7_ORITS|nr:hypothetical protein OTUT144_0217 [Orientia tsutsugamushi str. UT144]
MGKRMLSYKKNLNKKGITQHEKMHYKRQFRIRESMKGIIQKVYKRYYVISLNIVSINNSLFIAYMSVNANLG